MRKLPARSAPFLFALFLSGIMSLIVSGLATARAVGFEGLFVTWMSAWVISWAIAFPGVLTFAPLVRRIVARLVEPPPTG
ncbi:DUF2798 domain-containing protein [Salinarimonas ramus]|uniref:DUF2798 domain-containing protein n=1 Tax=Salinarimonas ramus TaxID=690164 RepID=A0A917QA05_9HYPH|nr:DUF2798 domain-containing protein [Salinarimonas ramus]GGK38766.1 hypothetical protein GCM10011322_27300 [Salinarimonas ramus]